MQTILSVEKWENVIHIKQKHGTRIVTKKNLSNKDESLIRVNNFGVYILYYDSTIDAHDGLNIDIMCIRNFENKKHKQIMKIVKNLRTPSKIQEYLTHYFKCSVKIWLINKNISKEGTELNVYYIFTNK